MIYEFKPSFDRSVKAFPENTKKDVKQICTVLIDIVSGHADISKGMGLKKLHGHFWEVRKGLKTRILFQWDKDHITFVLAGTHNDIKKHLKAVP